MGGLDGLISDFFNSIDPEQTLGRPRALINFALERSLSAVLEWGAFMRRRDFIRVLGGAAVAWPGAVCAQQPTTPVIGYLGLTTAQSNAYLLAPFRKSLSELGFDEGRNVNID